MQMQFIKKHWLSMIKFFKELPLFLPQHHKITMENKDLLILIFSAIFVGFTGLFVVMDRLLMAIMYLFGNAFIVYLMAYFQFKKPLKR